MLKKKYAVYLIAFLVLAVLIYLQFRTWRNFDWARFRETRPEKWLHVVHGIALIYIAYVFRAIRWKIFLKPVRPDASAASLIQPTIIGFTALTLLGRPGELIRPYLIARRQNLPFSSQLAVWTVERIFDFAAYAVLLITAIFASEELKNHLYYHEFRKIGFAVVALVFVMMLGAIAVHLKGDGIADWFEHRLSHLPKSLGHRIAARLREFGDGLNTIHGPLSLIAVTALSVGMWFMIVVAYQEVAHSYGVQILDIPRSKILILMGASMVGSFVQLPGVGGGSQLATIAAFEHIFDVPKELAASCGIMLWLVTFVAVVPLGLFLSHRERLSLRELSEQSAEADESQPAPTTS